MLINNIGKASNEGSDKKKFNTVDETDADNESELMKYCTSTNAIFLSKKFDTETHDAEGTQYALRLMDDCARLEVQKPSWPELSCDFSVDKFYELRDLLCSTELEEYTPKADADGKIVYETLEYAVFVSNNVSYDITKQNIYLKEPTNMDDLIEFFESLYEIAKEE
jgi:hypothetical protein